MSSLDIKQVERLVSRYDLSPSETSETARTILTDQTRVVHQADACRFFISSSAMPAGRSNFIASSRLGRSLESFPSWFDAIRTAACRLNQQADYLITANGTAADRFVRRVGQLWNIPVIEFRPLPSSLDSHWLENIGAEPNVVFYSVSFFENESTKEIDQPTDSVLAEFADRMVVLRVTGRGNIYRATKTRLQNEIDARQASPIRNTQILFDKALTKQSVANELVACGATTWWLYQDEKTEITEPQPSKRKTHFSAPVQKLDAINANEFLTHWTRNRAGRWPDESEAKFLDHLIFGCDQAEHGSFASLCRILASAKLLGSNQITRSNLPVVCWTEVPLDEYANRRTFRSHLGRWDFEPFGIAVKKDRLIEMGARDVIYGDDSTWEQLSIDDKPFFQQRLTNNGAINWELEQEWRTANDLDLRSLSVDDAFVFVPNHSFAEKICTLSRWPVVLLDS